MGLIFAGVNQMRFHVFLFVGMSLFQRGGAVNELGPFDKARSSHPAVFVPCNVLEYTVGNEQGYVFGGESSQRFRNALSDGKLYREATLDARRNLYKFLTMGDKSKTVEMSGARPLYQYTEGEKRRVILFVPKKNVRVFVPQPVQVRSPVSEEVNPPPVVQVIAENTRGKVLPKTITNVVVASNFSTNVVAVSSPLPVVTKSLLTNTVVAASTSNVVAAPQLSTNAVVALQPFVGIAAGENTVSTSRIDRLAVCLKQMNENPDDCTIMSEVARLYAERGNFQKASSVYAKIVECVVADMEINKMIAVELLVEAAEFEKENGNAELALNYYRAIVRCDSVRGWKLQGPITEARKNISQLLIKTF